MSDKKKWSTPVLRQITPEQAAILLMTNHDEATGRQVSAGGVGASQEKDRLAQDVVDLTRSLSDCGELLAACQSRLDASGSIQSTEAANANGDYSPPYEERERSRRMERKTSES